MKAAPFDYIAATSADHALQMLKDHGDDGMILAGGQTLVPMLAMRLARPAVLIDINRLADWAGIDVDGGAVRIRTATRQSAALKSQLVSDNLPLLVKALPWVGHAQTRNRGTVGGSIAHGDPAAEIPLVAVALGAEIVVQSVAGARSIAADAFYQGPMMSDRGEDEALTDVRFPVWDDAGRTGAGFHEVAERHGDFAVVSAGAQVQLDEAGICRKAALAVGGVSGTPVRLREAEANLTGNALTEKLVDEALAGIGNQMDPADDLHGSADYRRRVARVLIGRALADAVSDAGRGVIMSRRDISLTVNGKAATGAAEPRMTLLDFLRDELHLSGTHMGCEHGVCGACTVIVNGEPIRSCLMLAVQADGDAVQTVEGLCRDDGEPGVLQDAFRDAHGMQCGYCTPGMLMSAHALLQENLSPTDEDIREAIGGNICRCTGYTQIIDAIRLAADRMREQGT